LSVFQGFRLIQPTRKSETMRGVSLIELLIVVAVAIILMVIAMPNFIQFMRLYRRDAAVQQLVGDVRRARAEAIRTGWQYRVVGFNAGATNSFKGQYRLMARNSAAVAWPADTASAFESATQIAGPWVDMNSMFPGVSLNASDATEDFVVAFDSRGVRIEVDPSFSPLVISNNSATAKTVSISAVGSVKVE
jgi:Tfp pilus assembly protein FimT